MSENEKTPKVQRRKRLRSSQRVEKEDQRPPRRTRLESQAPAVASTESPERYLQLLKVAMERRVPSAEFMSQSLARYKAWKRSGAPHDTFCFTCNKAEEIRPCATCRRQYHESCKPKDSTAVHDGQAKGWYCEVCVVRKWHVDPPTLTPPASPPPETRNLVVEEGDSGQDVPPPPSETVPYSHQQQSPARNQNPTNATLSPNLSTLENTSHLSSGDGSIAHPIMRSSHVGSVGVAARPTPLMEPNAYVNYRPTVMRRSRYTTLPSEVDSALRVLYSELETAAELRQQIHGLETQVGQLRQDLNLRDRELQMAQRALEVARASQSELAKLRLEASQRQGSVQEAAALRAEKQHLETELQSSRTQIDEMSQTLQQWKQKLSALIAD